MKDNKIILTTNIICLIVSVFFLDILKWVEFGVFCVLLVLLFNAIILYNIIKNENNKSCRT